MDEQGAGSLVWEGGGWGVLGLRAVGSWLAPGDGLVCKWVEGDRVVLGGVELGVAWLGAMVLVWVVL